MQARIHSGATAKIHLIRYTRAAIYPDALSLAAVILNPSYESAPSGAGQSVRGLDGQGRDQIGCGGHVGDEVDGLPSPDR
jgi:hypothetical protein